MKKFLKAFLIWFVLTLSTIFAAYNYTQYAASFDRVEEALRVNKAYADYLPILQAQLSAAGIR